MLRYYTWALGEKVLGTLPGGAALYGRVGRLRKRATQGCTDSFVTALPVTRKVQELASPDATIMEVGSGWYHHDAFLLHLAGDYRVVLFDVVDKAWLPYIRNYLRKLSQHTDLLAWELGADEAVLRGKLEALLSLGSRAEIYEHCNFIPCITERTDTPFLPEKSIDFMVSNCVLVHVPPDVLLPELKSLRAMLKDDGWMYHHLGHDDHWAFHDGTMSWPSFNYMRYSDRIWRWFFETRLEYHNRLVKPEWIDLFRSCALEVVEYGVFVTDESREAVRSLPKIDRRFSKHDVEELAPIYSYVLLSKNGISSPKAEAPKALHVTPPSL